VRAVDAHAHGFDFLSDGLEVAFGLVVQVLAELFLDGHKSIVDTLLNVVVVERDCADREIGGLGFDVDLELVERTQLRPVGREDRFAVLKFVSEVNNVVFGFLLVLLFELSENLLAVVEFLFGAFHGACEEQDDAHNFFVSGNLLVEGFLLGLLLLVLAPVVDLFGAREHLFGGVVNGPLDALNGGLEYEFLLLVHIQVDFEEGVGLDG